MTQLRSGLHRCPGDVQLASGARGADEQRADGAPEHRRGLRLSGVKVYVSVYHPGSRTTPLEPTAQAQFARYAAALAESIPTFDDIIVGNEPNLNRFWLPQFGLDGANASAPAYLSLLARTYDALKAVDPGLRVWGGALAPRGGDRPGGARPTSSPTAFIQTMGTAYRASGRTSPVMDGLAIHPYPDNSSQSPDFPHPRSTSIGLADYEKLVALLGAAFDGTAQAGSTLPILYDEFGIESAVPKGSGASTRGPSPRRRSRWTSRSKRRRTIWASGSRSASRTWRECSSSTRTTRKALLSWQSGVYYADGSPKASLSAVRDSLDRTRGGSIARCDGLGLDVALKNVRFPGQAEFLRGKRDVRFRCTLDCAWEVVATRTTTGATAARVRGYGRWGRAIVATLRNRKLGRAPVRLTLTVTHPVNPGVPATRKSAVLRPA